MWKRGYLRMLGRGCRRRLLSRRRGCWRRGIREWGSGFEGDLCLNYIVDRRFCVTPDQAQLSSDHIRCLINPGTLQNVIVTSSVLHFRIINEPEIDLGPMGRDVHQSHSFLYARNMGMYTTPNPQTCHPKISIFLRLGEFLEEILFRGGE